MTPIDFPRSCPGPGRHRTRGDAITEYAARRHRPGPARNAPTAVLRPPRGAAGGPVGRSTRPRRKSRAAPWNDTCRPASRDPPGRPWRRRPRPLARSFRRDVGPSPSAQCAAPPAVLGRRGLRVPERDARDHGGGRPSGPRRRRGTGGVPGATGHVPAPVGACARCRTPCPEPRGSAAPGLSRLLLHAPRAKNPCRFLNAGPGPRRRVRRPSAPVAGRARRGPSRAATVARRRGSAPLVPGGGP